MCVCACVCVCVCVFVCVCVCVLLCILTVNATHNHQFLLARTSVPVFDLFQSYDGYPKLVFMEVLVV